MASGFTISPGGKGSNAAVACARQGAQVAVIARIGDDDFGRMALALWAARGHRRHGRRGGRRASPAAWRRSGLRRRRQQHRGRARRRRRPRCAPCPGRGRHALAGARVVMAPNEVPFEATLRGVRAGPRGRCHDAAEPGAGARAAGRVAARCATCSRPTRPSCARSPACAGGTPVAAAAARLLARGVGAVVGDPRRAPAARCIGRGRPPLRDRGPMRWQWPTRSARATPSPARWPRRWRAVWRLDAALAWANAAAALVGRRARRDRRHAQARCGARTACLALRQRRMRSCDRPHDCGQRLATRSMSSTLAQRMSAMWR